MNYKTKTKAMVLIGVLLTLLGLWLNPFNISGYSFTVLNDPLVVAIYVLVVLFKMSSIIVGISLTVSASLKN